MNALELVKLVSKKLGLKSETRGSYIRIGNNLNDPYNALRTNASVDFYVTGPILSIQDFFILPSWKVPTIDLRKPDSLTTLRKCFVLIKIFINESDKLLDAQSDDFTNLQDKLAVQLLEICS